MDYELKSLLEKKIKAMGGGNYVGSKTTTDETGEHLEITFKKQDGTLDKTIVDFPKPKDGLSVSAVDFVGDDMVFTMSDGSEVKIAGAKVVLRQYNSLTADKLVTPRKINGVYFDGTQDIIIGTGEVASVNGKTGNVILNKSDIGLSNTDDTSDLNKPVSTATQTALNAKADATHGHAVGDVVGLRAEIDAKLSITQAYTASQIDTKLNDKVDKIVGKGLSSEDYTTAEKAKLAGLEDSKFKGLHPKLAALELAYPTAESGAYAFVDGGVGQPNKLYNYSTSENKWKIVTGDVATMTPAQIKSAYESNADTNAFTDAEKAKLNGVAVGATANNADTQLRDRATHTGEQSISTIIGLQSALDGKALTSHTHNTTDINGLQTLLDNKANGVHAHNLADVTGLSTELDKKANKDGTLQTGLNAEFVGGKTADNLLGALYSTDTKNYYVDVTNGADTNDGLTAGAAFKTIAKATSLLPFLLGTVTINIADGVYSESINIKCRNLLSLTIKGNETTPANVVVNNMTLTGICSGYVMVSGLSFTSVTINSNISGCNYVRLYKCLYSKSSSLGAISCNYSTVLVDSCEFTTTRPAIQATNAKVHALNCIGTTSRLFTGAYSIFSYGGTVPTYDTLLLENTPHIGTSVVVNSIPTATMPAETVITTGFNAGYSGSIGCRVAQDGLKTIRVGILSRDTDFATDTTPVIKLPEQVRCDTKAQVSVIGFSYTPFPLNRVNGSLVEVSIVGTTLRVVSCGSVTSKVNMVESFNISYY